MGDGGPRHLCFEMTPSTHRLTTASHQQATHHTTPHAVRGDFRRPPEPPAPPCSKACGSPLATTARCPPGHEILVAHSQASKPASAALAASSRSRSSLCPGALLIIRTAEASRLAS